jgi:hypothetical protein
MPAGIRLFSRCRCLARRLSRTVPAHNITLRLLNPRLSRTTNNHPGAKMIALSPIRENAADATSVACFLLMSL